MAKDFSNERVNLHCRKCGFITVLSVRRTQTGLQISNDDKDLSPCPNCGGKSFITGGLIVTEKVE